MDILYKLKLHERHAPDNNSMYRRVPGGWAYSDMNGACFIPFNNEFQTASKQPNAVDAQHPCALVGTCTHLDDICLDCKEKVQRTTD